MLLAGMATPYSPLTCNFGHGSHDSRPTTHNVTDWPSHVNTFHIHIVQLKIMASLAEPFSVPSDKAFDGLGSCRFDRAGIWQFAPCYPPHDLGPHIARHMGFGRLQLDKSFHELFNDRRCNSMWFKSSEEKASPCCGGTSVGQSHTSSCTQDNGHGRRPPPPSRAVG